MTYSHKFMLQNRQGWKILMGMKENFKRNQFFFGLIKDDEIQPIHPIVFVKSIENKNGWLDIFQP